MKYVSLCLLMVFAVACGRSDESPDVAQVEPQSVAEQAVIEAEEIVERARSGEPMFETGGTEGCRVFDSGLIEEFFQTGEAEVVYTASIPVRRAGHVLCSARWDKPDKEQLEKAYKEALMEWGRNLASGDRRPQPKLASGVNEVSLTLVANSFDSADAAVTSLEDTVATLSKGVSFEVGGKQHVTKMEFGAWIDGVGDKAIFSDKGGLMFAYDAKRYALKVSVMGDQAQDREKAIELAQRLIELF